MRLQRINHAEAIIEPFFDGSDSDRPSNKISALSHYTIKCSDEVNVAACQIWCGVRVSMNSGKPAWIELSRPCDLNIEGFDVFRVFSMQARTVKQSIRAQIDGEWIALCQADAGTDNTDERDYPIAGRHMTALSIRLEQDGSKDSVTVFEWLGLSNAAREAELVRERSDFPIDWPDMLKQEGDFEPQMGLWFDSAELEAIRARVCGDLLSPIYEKMRAHAEECLSWEPEKDIGEFIPNPDRRWVRARDREKRNTSAVMQELAFVGLIEKDARMMTMAARMALSVAHCTHWTESIMGALPGCGWHHRSFTEEVYCHGCALVLDWAGGWLTDYGRMAIVDAIVMKGLPRLESDFKRQEYIRGMNQGIVFSGGRIFGLLACRHFFPRYDAMIQEAVRDLDEMIADYIQPDGGTPEGPSYWAYTFGHVMPMLYVLSRYHGKPFRSSLTPALEKSGLHALSLLSIVEPGNRKTPVNDASGGAYAVDLLAAYYALTGNEDYLRLMGVNLRKEVTAPTLELFIMAPDRVPEDDCFVQQGFTALPDLGQARIIRPDARFGRVSMNFFAGLADEGHFHMDKGSFILETDKEVLLMDRGVVGYFHPDMALLQRPEYHNLLLPELSGARIEQKPTREGAFLEQASYENGLFAARGDITRAWDDTRVLKNTRVITSAEPDSYLVEDEMLLAEEAPVSFILNTTHACEPIENGVIIRGQFADVRVEAVDWTACEVDCALFGIDEKLQDVWRVCLRHAAAKEHKLQTRITLLNK